MDFKNITIEDKQKFDDYYEMCKCQNSESNFTTLFSWREALNIKFVEKCGCLAIVAAMGNTKYHCMPLGNGDVVRLLDDLYQNGYKIINPVTNDMKDYLEKIYPNKFSWTPNRDFFDYVYDIEKLISLEGKKMHAKRGHFNSFVISYKYRYNEINESNIDLCVKFFNTCVKNESEKVAGLNIFNEFFNLGVKGAFLEVDEDIAALTVGQEHKGFALIHIEKANPSYKGAYAAINKLFLENTYKHLKYVNREEDMGIEGLRKAKLSYHPEFFIEKWVGKRV